MPSAPQWPAISHETLPWERSPEDLALIPKSRRRKIGSTYEAAVPLAIAKRTVSLPTELESRLAEVLVSLARFDAQQSARGYDLPALLLRSESSASSQIENLTSSVRNVALAELSETAPHNAQLIAGNVAAMRAALSLPDTLSVEGILEVHRTLINRGGVTFGGSLRTEQVWVGGTPYSPHGALYVPPAPERVEGCLEDLLAFSRKEDINPLAKAALVHAQFETIHPFIDGNGRTGRVLLAKVLKSEGVLSRSTLPISAGLLHSVDAYMAALTSYQEGDPIAVVEQLADALELAVVIAQLVARQVDGLLESWNERLSERRGSSIHQLANVLVEQPVVDSSYLAGRLGITRRAVTDLLARACSYGILRPLGNRQRGEFYQADELIAILEDVSSMPGIRRVLSGRI